MASQTCSSLLGVPHVVCIPYPAQGHINPMLTLAKLLNSSGFYVTFVNTEYNQRRLHEAWGHDSKSLDLSPEFSFRTIPDGLPASEGNVTQDVPSLCISTSTSCLAPFRDLLVDLNSSTTGPPVTCIVSDAVMSFTLDAADELGIPEVLFWTTSACGFLGYMQYRPLLEKGLVPLKDEKDMENGYLDMMVDWIPGMENICLKDLPSFIKTTNIDDIMLNFLLRETERTSRGRAIILNTFDYLEEKVLLTLSAMFPRIFTIGPLHLLANNILDEQPIKKITSGLWKDDVECIKWLDCKEANSVVYVNFGSITVVTTEQLTEFAWGLANSKKPFLWIIRPDLVLGESAILPVEFVKETKDRGMLASWCPQEQVLKHIAVGVFLSHMGWNSTIESISYGVPMACWPFFAEQQTNCKFACKDWGIGMEIENNVQREDVKKLVIELMEGIDGTRMKNKAMDWKAHADKACKIDDGTSACHFNDLVSFLACC